MAQQDAYDFVTLLMVSSRVIINKIQSELNEKGYSDVRPAHGFIFMRLSHGAATGQDLAEYLDISKQAASQMIEYLEKQGYVQRQPLPSDTRNKLVILTDKGWRCIATTEVILRQLQKDWTNLLGPERLETMHQDLQTIVQNANEGVMPNKLRPLE